MKNVSKFIFVSVGGLMAMMVMGMIFSAIFGIRSDEIKSLDLIDAWMWYRVAFYVLAIASWSPLSRYLTRTRRKLEFSSREEEEDHAQKQERDFQYLASQWWKVALTFVFVEVVIIQQFGL